MNELFRPYFRKIVLIFFDDILIYSSSLEKHLQHVRQVFEVLLDNQLYAKRKNCQFGVRDVSYLGNIISPEGLLLIREKCRQF